jgi:hypothetical protein
LTYFLQNEIYIQPLPTHCLFLQTSISCDTHLPDNIKLVTVWPSEQRRAIYFSKKKPAGPNCRPTLNYIAHVISFFFNKAKHVYKFFCSDSVVNFFSDFIKISSTINSPAPDFTSDFLSFRDQNLQYLQSVLLSSYIQNTDC